MTATPTTAPPTAPVAAGAPVDAATAHVDVTAALGDLAARMMADGVPPDGFAALLVGAAAGVLEAVPRADFLALCGDVWDAVHAAAATDPPK